MPIKIAIIHDWLVTYAGAERVLEQMLICFPDADIFSLVDFLGSNKRSFMNEPTSRFAYASVYTPMYVAFRYVGWDPNAGPINPNTGIPYGEIVSGPLSRVVKIIHRHAPFMLDYPASALIGAPCAQINGAHVPEKLRCMFETHLP